MTSAKPRVLCVDDEERVLAGLRRTLRRDFDITGVGGGHEGLKALEEDGPFEVVISDMQMPRMNGAEFLAQARKLYPDIVRFLLTGQADLDSAIAAVNEGAIFRFLTKPCPPASLIAALQDGVEQHRLITAERELLERTLRGSVAALSEVLSLTNPAAFGRATRVTQTAAALGETAQVEPRWVIEVAAMLAPIGAIVLPSSTVEKMSSGQQLSTEEEAMAARVPAVADSLLAKIPRLEPVREALAHQTRRYDGKGDPNGPSGEAIPIAARVLRVAQDYDALLEESMDPERALGVLRSRNGCYDPELVQALSELQAAREGALVRVRELTLAEVRPGMVLSADVVSVDGVLLVSHGHPITPQLLERLKNIAFSTGIQEPLMCKEPIHSAT